MRLLFLAGVLLAAPAAAQDRDLCTDRPGLGTPACTVERGRVVVEAGIADWTREHDASTRTDTLTDADLLVRIGIADHAEVQVGWTAFGDVRIRSRATGAREEQTGTGDVTLALRRNLTHPDGSGRSFAVMPYIILPTGGAAIGAQDWVAGVLLPMSADLADGVSIEWTPEVDAAANGDGSGRHLSYGSVAGLSFDLTKSLSFTPELSLFRDRDPQEHVTQALAGLSLAWQPGRNTQVDVGSNLGLNRASADVELYVGVARRF